MSSKFFPASRHVAVDAPPPCRYHSGPDTAGAGYRISMLDIRKWIQTWFACLAALLPTLLLAPGVACAQGGGPPQGLPRYDVSVVLDTHRLLVRVCEDVTWT